MKNEKRTLKNEYIQEESANIADVEEQEKTLEGNLK